MNPAQLADSLQPEMQKAIIDLIANNVSAIAVELTDASENKLKVSVGLSLTLIDTKLYTSGTIAFTRKFSDEVERTIDIEDPSKPRLKGI